MLRERYRAEFGEDGERLETAWIVKTIQGEAPAADATREVWEAALAKASEIARAALAAELERVRQPADFAVVAREVSDDAPTKANGGRRQGRFRVDAFPEAIATAVTALQVGQSTPPILYGRAWVSFQLVERRRVSYEDAKSELEFELKHQRPVLPDIGNYRNSLARQVKAEILPGMAR
jgi:parvulin-like peptidyl-prolyl isomerase